MSVETIHVDPATRFVRSLDGDYFLLREAAQAAGVSQYTLRKLISDDVPECIPSKYAMFGKVKIYLYTRDDIEGIRGYLAKRHTVHDHDGPARKVGRPPKYTKSERDWRGRMYSKAWYWKNREKLLLERGDEKGAEKARKRADEITKELKKRG